MKKILTENLSLKIWAVLIAVGLWLYVYSEHQPRYFATVSVKIDYRNKSRSLLISKAPRTVDVKVKGRPEDIGSLDPGKMLAVADLTGVGAGEHTLKLKLSGSETVQVINPDIRVQVALQSMNSIQQPVEVVLYGSLPIGKTPGAPRLSEKTVSFFGKEKELSRIRKAVVKVGLSGQTEKFTLRLPVAALDSQGNAVKGVFADPEEVAVTIPVYNAVAKTKNVRLVYRGDLSGGSGGIIPEIDPPAVTVFGEEDTLNAITVIPTEEFEAALCRAGKPFTVRLDPPKGVFTSPQTVRISCRMPDRESRRFTVSVETMNLAAGLSADLEPDKIEVTVSGAPGFVNSLTIDMLAARVDALGKSQGIYNEIPAVLLRQQSEEGVEISYDKSPIKVMIRRR